MTMPHDCEHCVSRRGFLATAVGVAALTSLSGCGDGVLMNPVRPPALPAGPVVVKVSDFPDLATPGFLVRVPFTNVAVKRVDATTFAALSMICTHQGCRTSIVNGQRFDCPCHFSRFDGDGAVINGPTVAPFTGDPVTPLEQLNASYNAATDEITIS